MLKPFASAETLPSSAGDHHHVGDLPVELLHISTEMDFCPRCAGCSSSSPGIWCCSSLSPAPRAYNRRNRYRARARSRCSPSVARAARSISCWTGGTRLRGCPRRAVGRQRRRGVSRGGAGNASRRTPRCIISFTMETSTVIPRSLTSRCGCCRTSSPTGPSSQHPAEALRPEEVGVALYIDTMFRCRSPGKRILLAPHAAP